MGTYAVLVADDDREIVQTLSRQLEQLAKRFGDTLEIFPVYTGYDVLVTIEEQKIDVLFLDYHFERGIDADKVIQQIVNRPVNMLIILMSARDKDELDPVIIDGRKKLGDRFKFLRKPFDELEIQDKYLEAVDFMVRQPYPFPLAYVHEALAASTTAQGKVAAMKDLIEVLIKFSFGILISDAYRLGLTETLATRNIWKIDITTKAWLSWLEDLVECLKDHKNKLFMPEILILLEHNTRGKSISLITRFVDDIQDTLGHGYVKEESWYGLLANKYSRPLQQLYDQFAFTSQYKLIIVEDIDISDDEDISYIYNIRNLMGAETRFRLSTIQSKHAIKKHLVYLIDGSGNHLLLSPWLEYMICENCAQDRLYILEEIQPENLLYNAYCNHRQYNEKSLDVYNKKYSSLFVIQSSEPYKLIGIAGKTEHSQVVKAWDMDLKRTVAIKSFLFPNFQTKDYYKEELLKHEAQLLAQLDHPNIGHIYHLLHEPLKIVMEWVEGPSLQSILDFGKPLSLREVTTIGIKLAGALQYAHERGVVHRDIKPSNIILRNSSEPVLIDFGVARIIEFDTASRISIKEIKGFTGTPPYSAPEQLVNAEPVGPAADLFSLGCVLYELLEHQLPFEYGNDPLLYPNNLFPPPPRKDIPEKIYTTICFLLKEDPEKRFNAEQLGKELQAYILSLDEKV